MRLRVAKKLLRWSKHRRGRDARWRLAGRRLAHAAGRRTRLLSPGIQGPLRPRSAYLVDYGSGPQRARTLGEWAMWFECWPLRRVAYTVTAAKTVSTVLLGMGTVGPPRAAMYESAWWDTEKRSAGDIEILAQYQTRAEAIAGHARLVKQARKEVQ
jgi:hypothetical protein